MRVVIDASVAIKWMIPEKPDEPDLDRATEILVGIADGVFEVFAPPHWAAEVLAVVARIDPDHVDDALLLLDGIDASLVIGTSALRRACRLAIDLRQHLFDTLYHAVALEVGATLVTADERYFAKAKPVGSIQLLHEWQV